MTELTEQDIPAGVAAKSDQLNADDLMAAPVTATITAVRVGDKEHPWFIDLADYPKRPYKPCVMMRRLMVDIMGDKPKRWVGQKITLYRDPEVKYKGDVVGGIRISHFSALSEPKTVSLTARRGAKIEWVACPLEDEKPTLTPEDEQVIELAREHIAAATTMEEMAGIGDTLKSMSNAVKAAIRPAYAARKKELEQG